MKRKGYLLIGLVLGLVFGWALGFLRFPYLEKNLSFLVGFATAWAGVSLLFLLLKLLNNHKLPALFGNRTATANEQNNPLFRYPWIIALGVFVAGMASLGWLVNRQHASHQVQLLARDKKVQALEAWVISLKNNELLPVMHSLLEEAAAEVKKHPGRTLSDTTITRIASLSFALKTYANSEWDSLTEQRFNPARGQLLQALLLMNMDSSSFAQIKEKSTFAGAELQGADLHGLNLSSINLRGAQLKDANLVGTNLTGADLAESLVWGARLLRADLSRANLKRADLRWAQLNEAMLAGAVLDGANLCNAQLRKADLTNTSVQWADANGVLFNEAMLQGSNFTGTDLTRAQLTQTNLQDAVFKKVLLTEANLEGSQWNGAVVDENWFEQLKKWQPAGMHWLQENHTVVKDTSDTKNGPVFRLKKNEE